LSLRFVILLGSINYESPTEISSKILKVANSSGVNFVYVSFKEIRTKILDKLNSPCRNYEANVDDEISFIVCSKMILRQKITLAVNCTLNGMEELISPSSRLSGEEFLSAIS